MKLENNLGTDAIRPLVLRIAIPSMLAQFVSVLYSIVDRMYIGNIPDVGSVALAGAGVCGPVVTMVGSVAFWVGIGGSPLMSMKMGQGDMKTAKKILANSFLLLAVASVLLVALIYPFREPMLRYFGASDTTYPYASTYFSIYLTGTFFALMATGMNQFIISQGFAKTGMYSVIIGAVLNIVLDPVFIFALHMGVAGAAVATVLSQMASCAFVLSFLFGKKVPVKISFGGYDRKLIQRILLVGFTPFIIIAVDNVMIISMNSVLQTYGGPGEGDMLITCATIVQSFMLVITMPLGGITGGTQTILAFNYGAGQPDRVKKAQRFIFLLSAGYTTILFILAQTAGHIFVRLGPGPDRRGCKDHKDLHPGSDPLKHPVCDRRRLHWPWKGPAFPAPVLFPEAGLLPSALFAAPVLRSQSHLLRGAHFRHHRPCGIHLHIRRGHEADLKKAGDPQLLRTAGWAPALPGHIREMPAGQASLVILTQLPAPYIQKNTAIPPFREFWQCFLLQLFLLVVVLLALGDCESESLSRHLVARQIFVVGGDLIHQLAIDDLHDPVGRGLYYLVVTGGEDHNAREFLHSVVEGRDGLHIQMVRGLVKHQHVGPGDHHFGQHAAHPLASGEDLYLLDAVLAAVLFFDPADSDILAAESLVLLDNRIGIVNDSVERKVG